MRINRALLVNGVAKTIEESLDFSSVSFDPTHIRSIPKCDVKATLTDYDELLYVQVEIKATVIGVCSYTLEDVELKFNINESLTFSSNEEDEDSYYEKDMIFDLDSYILGILLANVPVRIIKKGAKLPENGNGYRVMSEDDYEKEKKQKPDPRWDKLDSVQFDDD